MALTTDHPVIRELTAGAVAGAVGTVVMSTLMLTAQRAGLLGEQPPRKLSDAVLDAVAYGRADGELDALARRASIWGSARPRRHFTNSAVTLRATRGWPVSGAAGSARRSGGSITA